MLSVWICFVLQKAPTRKIIGAQLATLTFASAFIAPQISSSYSSINSTYSNSIIYIDASTLTNSTYQWPLNSIGITQKYSGFHPGIDLASPWGTAVKPITDGTVKSVTKNAWVDYGNYIIIEHSNGTASLYAHLSKITVTESQQVDKSMSIGTVGSTGKSTGSHLHLEIYQNNNAINPLDVLPSLPTPEKLTNQK